MSYVALQSTTGKPLNMPESTDAYFSADVETDGPIPGPYSILLRSRLFTLDPLMARNLCAHPITRNRSIRK